MAVSIPEASTQRQRNLVRFTQCIPRYCVTMGRMDEYSPQSRMLDRLGFIVPVWYPPGTSASMRRSLLEVTLQDVETCVRPENICLVNDGDADSRNLLKELSRTDEFQFIDLETNKGKEYAVTLGMERLLETRSALAFLAVRDADGDHFIQDLPHLFRTAEAVQRITGPVMVIGRRNSLTQPMGWLRGELERLQNRVLLDAMRFNRARAGTVLDLRFCVSYGDFPDFQSGYKMYSREAAQRVFNLEASERMGPLSPEEFWHYGTESVSVVEGILQGVTLAEMNRATYRGQPVSGFATFQAAEFYSSVIAWILWRLQIPSTECVLLLDNHIPRLDLWFQPEGRRLLQKIRDIVAGRLGLNVPLSPPKGTPFL